jgi:hypothetical protein
LPPICCRFHIIFAAIVSSRRMPPLHCYARHAHYAFDDAFSIDALRFADFQFLQVELIPASSALLSSAYCSFLRFFTCCFRLSAFSVVSGTGGCRLLQLQMTGRDELPSSFSAAFRFSDSQHFLRPVSFFTSSPVFQLTLLHAAAGHFVFFSRRRFF